MHCLRPSHRNTALLLGILAAGIIVLSGPHPMAMARHLSHPQSGHHHWHSTTPGVDLPSFWHSPMGFDADRDGLTNWIEVNRTGTDWRRADSDGDGVDDRVEVLPGSDPLDPTSVPDPSPPPEAEPDPPPPPPQEPPETPPSDTTPPDTSIDSGPSGSVTATTAPASRDWTVQAPEPPPAEEPPGEPSSCAAGAISAASAAAARSAVTANESVCATAAIGDLDLSNLGDRSGVVVSTDGGSIGHLEIDGTTGLTVRSARLRSVTIRGANRTAVEDSTIGGTAANRVMDQLIFMPDQSNDVIIRDNDIGWTSADDSGNTGYGCRCYGKTDRLRFVGNVVHDIAADGFQGTNGSDVLIDRNKIGPVGANPGSSEHSDNVQIVGNGPNLRITNNWLYEQGYYDGKVTGNAGSTYIHGGTSNSVLYENNLVQIARGRTEICGLGTGGTSRSNITIRRNTWVEGGQQFSGFPGFEWDCDSGSGNTVEGNIAVDPDGGFAQDGSSSAATFSGNLWGTPSLVTLDGQGNCVSANCNPANQEPIGYRKPTGVDW